MRPRHIALAALLTFLCCSLRAQEIVFTPQWVPQAQFAGFYMALEKGFYAEEGLIVSLRHVGVNSNETPADLLFRGDTDIAGMQTFQSVILRSQGRPIVNIMQITQRSGLWCVSHSPLSSVADLNGLRVGKWLKGYSEICEVISESSGVSINWTPFQKNVTLFVYGAVDATLCYSYSEYIDLLLAAGDIPQQNVLKFSDFGFDQPEDGLYVTEKFLKDNPEAVEAFVRASRRGWDYARENPDEAVEVSMRYSNAGNVSTNAVHQRLMLQNYLDLQLNSRTGEYDYAPITPEAFESVNDALLNAGFIDARVDYDKLIRR